MKPLVGILLLSACSWLACGETSNGEPSGPAGAPATVQIFSGNQQRAEVLTLLPEQLIVEVLDADGRFVSGETVSFTTASGGSLTPADAVSNEQGQARSSYTLGPGAGTQTVDAAVGDITAQFVVNADAGSASRVVLVAGDEQTGQAGSDLGESIVVRATDSGGNPVDGANVNFLPGSGSASPRNSVTDAAGLASTNWTLGPSAGPQSMEVGIFAGAALIVSATALPGPLQLISIESGQNQIGTRGTTLPQAIVMSATDAFDNAIAGISVTFDVGGVGTIVPGAATTDADGRVEAVWTLGAALGTQTLTVTAAGLTPVIVSAEASVTLTVLDHVAIDAVLDHTGNRIVTVSGDPSELNVVDPSTGVTTSVALDLTPTAVTVQPDGAYAAVGHNGFISYVDLSALSVDTVYAVTADVSDLELPGNGWVYAFPRIDQWETIRSIELSTGTEHTTGTIRAGTKVRLHPSGEYIYGANNGLSPSDFEKYDISSGIALILYDSPYHGDYAFSGNLWIYDDGTRIIARSSNVFSSSSVRDQDLLYVGSLPEVNSVTAAAHSSILERVVLVGTEEYWGEGGDELASYTDAFLTLQGTLALPAYIETGQSGSELFPSSGRFVFANAAGTAVYVLLRGKEPYVGRFNTALAVFDAADIP